MGAVVLGRTINGGTREGVYSSLGTFVGGSVHVLGAALGLSAILAASATAFQVIRCWRGLPDLSRNHDNSEPNPKTALFFLSFIPQFVSPAAGHTVLQFLILGTVSISLNTCADLLVVAFAGALAQEMRKNDKFNRRQRTASGAGMIGLGVYVAVR